MAFKHILSVLTTCLFLSGSQALQAQFSFSRTTAPLSISLSPSTVSLGPGQSQQFNVTVLGSNNTDVMWSLSPMVGSINNGFYRAPIVITSPTIVTLKVISMIDMSVSASATITLSQSVATQASSTQSGTVTVTPSSVSLGAGQSAQFSVQVSG